MGILGNLFGNTKLTTTDRNQIWKMFGSFYSNNLVNKNDTTLLQKGYESNIEVYSVIRKIVETSKNGEWIVEQKQSDGSYIEIEDTTIHELMENPNESKGYVWDDITEQLIIYLLANGNSYMVGQDSITSTLIQEVDVLPSNYVEIRTNNDFFTPDIKYDFKLGGANRTFMNGSLEHIKLFNPNYCSVQDSLKGLSVIQVASMVVQASNDKWEADASILQNKGMTGLITDSSNRPMTEDEAQIAQHKFNHDIGGAGKFGQIKVTNKDLKYINMGVSSADLQLIEKDTSYLRAVCNVFGLSSSLFNDPANKTFNNQKEAEKSLYNNVVIPICKKISDHHTRFIAKNHFPDGRVRMRMSFDHIESLQTDKTMEAVKDKVVMEGINLVLNMPVSQEAKRTLLESQFGLSESVVASLTTNIEINS